MVVKKRLNNNVVFALDGKQEMIVIGKGIGFQVYPGNQVNQDSVERIFLPTDDMSLSQIALAVGDVSPDVIKITDEIIQMGTEMLHKEISSKALFPLIDHINFALQRQADQILLVSPLHWEVKRFYPKETKVGMMAIRHICKRTGIIMPETEAVFIALHFVNAQFDKETMEATIEFTEILSALTQIVKYHFQIEIDEDSFVYNRFLTHLRYYLMRQRSNSLIEDVIYSIHDIVLTKFPKEAACADKMAKYLEKRCGWETPEEEKVYLILHIHCLAERTGREHEQMI